MNITCHIPPLPNALFCISAHVYERDDIAIICCCFWCLTATITLSYASPLLRKDIMIIFFFCWTFLFLILYFIAHIYHCAISYYVRLCEQFHDSMLNIAFRRNCIIADEQVTPAAYFMKAAFFHTRLELHTPGHCCFRAWRRYCHFYWRLHITRRHEAMFDMSHVACMQATYSCRYVIATHVIIDACYYVFIELFLYIYVSSLLFIASYISRMSLYLSYISLLVMPLFQMSCMLYYKVEPHIRRRSHASFHISSFTTTHIFHTPSIAMRH
jgi:hypothetical protein